MDNKGMPSTLFVNDGSFLERFKQLQQQEEHGNNTTAVPKTAAHTSRSGNFPASGAKLAFSLKHKSNKVVAPSLKLSEEDKEDDDKGSVNASARRQKLDTSNICSKRVHVAPPPPSDPTVKNIAEKLASFVAKNGRQIEHITRQKNPGDTPFKFLFDSGCAEYKYYEYRLQEEENALAQTKGGSSSSTASSFEKSYKRRPDYQIPATALYDIGDVRSEAGRIGEAHPPTDPIAMMEFYAKKAAAEERKRPPKQSHDELPPPASLQAPAKRGHHMGDFIPPEELEKFLASCNDAAGRRAAREAAENAKIQADNVGHKLLSKMGWKEGEGVGGSRKGIADPIMAGGVKTNNLGVGAQQPGQVTPDDDIYEQYKKRMMLGYRYRPNPLNNPRKAYY